MNFYTFKKGTTSIYEVSRLDQKGIQDLGPNRNISDENFDAKMF